jgi:hypothetical protein
MAPTSASTSVPMPPRGAKNTGADGSGTAARCAAHASMSDGAPLRAAASSCGTVAASDSSSVSPALMPPTSGSTRRSSTSSPSRSRTTAPMVGSPSGATSGRARSSRARSIPAVDTMPLAASSSRSVGTPRTWAAGSGRSSPRLQTRAVRAAGDTRSPSMPSSRHSSRPSGTRARKASADSSSIAPSNGVVRSFPPVPAGSTTTTEAPVLTASHAAARPVIPAPTTTRSTCATGPTRSWRPRPRRGRRGRRARRGRR